MRGAHELIAVFEVLVLPEVSDYSANQRAFGMPEDEADANLLVYGEQVKSLADQSMVCVGQFSFLIFVFFRTFVQGIYRVFLF